MDEKAVAPRLRLRLGLGAGVVLLVLAAGIAVLISVVAPRGSTAVAAQPVAVHTVHSVLPTANDSPTAIVHVVGEVEKPGLYELPAGDRIVDAVTAAGGFTPNADQAALNLAQVIEDGQQIVVARKGAAPATGSAAVAGAPVDLNTADLSTLETLDGIGPALAQRILDYRTAHGSFGSVNDLQKVTGIGPKKFAAIKDHVST